MKIKGKRDESSSLSLWHIPSSFKCNLTLGLFALTASHIHHPIACPKPSKAPRLKGYHIHLFEYIQRPTDWHIYDVPIRI